MCALVCPFDVITYHVMSTSVGMKSVAVKCDLCINRLRADHVPACVEICKSGALLFGEINSLVKSSRQRFSKRISIMGSFHGTEPIYLPSNISEWRRIGDQISRLNGVDFEEEKTS
jgi:carbon-monoxide dehydrogenase iron sulfur subunit